MAISTHPRMAAFDLPEPAFEDSPWLQEAGRANHIRLGGESTDVRFSGSVSVGPLYYAYHHQDLLLVDDRPSRTVRDFRDFRRTGFDGDQPVRRLHTDIGLDCRRHRRHHLLAHRVGIRSDRVSYQ